MRLNYLALPLAFVALSASAQEQAPAPRPQSMLGSLPGYLKPGETPDDRILLSPPPASGSAAEGRDKDAASAAIALRGAPRWDLATRDADLSSPTAAFTCALGVELTLDKAPRSATLLRRAMVDLAMSTNGSKAKYQRQRPFVLNTQPICTPAQDQILRGNGSYPSGHSAIGFGLGLLLGELAPDRATSLVARGIAFGKSRVICNVHWLSDVEAGRVAASAVVARLHAVPEFRTDLEAARSEIAALRSAANASATDKCQTEQAALASD